MGTFETPNFTFIAFDSTVKSTKELLFQAWKKHADQTGADPDYMEEYQDDIMYVEISSGVVVRDYSVFYPKTDTNPYALEDK